MSASSTAGAGLTKAPGAGNANAATASGLPATPTPKELGQQQEQQQQQQGGAAKAPGGSTNNGAPAVAPTVSLPSQPTTTATFGPLPSARTITMTMVPDWNQEAIRSPLRPATLSVVIGPANTTPEQAKWVFTINL
jgi:hypothetical protein